MRLRVALIGFGIFTLGLAFAEDKPKGYKNLTGSGFLLDKVEYQTYDELVHPLKKKLDKGKLDEVDFKVEERLIPKGGILAVEAKTRQEDPVVQVVVRSDSAQLAVCDDATSKPGLTMKHSGFGHKYVMKEDENNPVMIYECPFRTAFPDSFTVQLVTVGKAMREYRFQKVK